MKGVGVGRVGVGSVGGAVNGGVATLEVVAVDTWTVLPQEEDSEINSASSFEDPSTFLLL